MSKIIDYLAKLELSDMEARSYLKLLETGPITVSEFARLMNIRRTTAYLYTDPLVSKGLVIKIVKGSKKLIAPTPPENIEGLIEQKLNTAQSLKETFPKILEEIKNEYQIFQDNTNVEIKFYKGIYHARNIYLEALKADEFRSYMKIDKREPLFPSNASVFSEAFKENNKLKIWEIIYDPESSAVPSKESRSHIGRYFYKYMPKGKKLSSEDILIYDGKVAVINFRGGKTSIVLQSKDLYNNFKEIFELLWDVLPEPPNPDL